MVPCENSLFVDEHRLQLHRGKRQIQAAFATAACSFQTLGSISQSSEQVRNKRANNLAKTGEEMKLLYVCIFKLVYNTNMGVLDGRQHSVKTTGPKFVAS